MCKLKKAISTVSNNVRTLVHIKSLRVIMALSFSILMVFIYGMTYFALSKKYVQINDNNAAAFSKQAIEQLYLNIEAYIDEMVKVSQYVNFQLFIDQQPSKQEINGMLKDIMDSRDTIKSIAVFSREGDLVYGTMDALKSDAKVKSKQWFNLALIDKSKTFFSAPYVQNIFDGSYNWVITLSRNVSFYRMEHTTDNVLLIDISISAMDKMIRNVGMGQRGYAYIVDDYGNIVYHPHQQLIHIGLKHERTDEVLSKLDGTYLSNRDQEKIITSIKTLANTGWKLVTVMYVKDVIFPAKDLTVFFITTIGIGLAAIVVVSVLISIFISRPISKLEKSMKLVEEGNFSTSIDVKGDIEVERLSHTFNVMVHRIKSLMDQNLKDQEEKRKSEFKALQMQINPHFLYNTLESIVWMAENEKNNAVVAMVSSLSKLFRIALSKGKETILVKEECEHVEHYLTIQKMRYRDKFDFIIQCDPQAAECSTVKLILQPLVENAIYHGIKTIEDKGFIEISAQKQGEHVVFTVKDNGTGMDEERLNQIFSDGFTSVGGSAVGIKNVNERIKLYYGESFGINIESTLDVGTTVKIVIPACKSC